MKEQLNDEYYMSQILRLTKDFGVLSIGEVFLERELAIITEPHRSRSIQSITQQRLKSKIIPTPPQNKHFSRQLKNTSYRHVKICPKCVRQNGTVKASWLDLYETECEIHNCALISSCSKCGLELTWELPLLASKCTNPYCQSQLDSEKDMFAELNISQKTDVLVASLLMTQDIEQIKTQPHYFPVKNIISAMQQTLAFLTMATDVEDDFDEGMFNILASTLENTWSVFIVKKQTVHNLKPDTAMGNLMLLSDAMSVLGLGLSDINLLIEQGFIARVISSVFCSNQIVFDVSLYLEKAIKDRSFPAKKMDST